MTKPTAYALFCGHVERFATNGLAVELSRTPSARNYSVYVFRRNGEVIGSYLSSRLDVAWSWYRTAVAQVRDGKWY